MKVSLSTTSSQPSEEYNKEHIKKETKLITEKIGELQYKMNAHHKHSILVVLQGMDASGKDGIVNKVFRKTSPNGINTVSFKKPTEEEFEHDFLWRIHKNMPRQGQITVFNRSHYEDILVPSVYKYIDPAKIDERYEHINNFEKLIEASGTKILKFYLHVSPKVQKQRLKERIEIKRKNWKHNDNDALAVRHREKFEAVYESIFERCNDIPWTIVPADTNWYKSYIVAKGVLECLQNLDLTWPNLDTDLTNDELAKLY